MWVENKFYSLKFCTEITKERERERSFGLRIKEKWKTSLCLFSGNRLIDVYLEYDVMSLANWTDGLI